MVYVAANDSLRSFLTESAGAGRLIGVSERDSVGVPLNLLRPILDMEVLNAEIWVALETGELLRTPFIRESDGSIQSLSWEPVDLPSGTSVASLTHVAQSGRTYVLDVGNEVVIAIDSSGEFDKSWNRLGGVNLQETGVFLPGISGTVGEVWVWDQGGVLESFLKLFWGMGRF